MGFNFPNSPSVGSLFQPAGGPTYVWDGTVWRDKATSRALISDTPPPGAVNGDLWWESDSGFLYIYYNDGDSSQWVQCNTPSVNQPIKTADSYNRTVNPAMQHSQENGNTASTTTASNGAYYAADQWICRWGFTTGTGNGGRYITTTPNGSGFHVGFNCVVAATLAAGDYAITTQRIEGTRVADFGWGTAKAKQVILRFCVAAPAGTYSVSVQNGGTTRCYIAQYTVSVAEANTWTVRTLVIPGDTTGTWSTDTSQGINLEFVWAIGTTYLGVLGWQAGSKYSAPGQATSLAGSTIYALADVGLYLDPQSTGLPPPWVMPDYASELLACQRYWEVVGMTMCTAITYNNTAFFKNTKRIAPTLAVVAGGLNGGQVAGLVHSPTAGIRQVAVPSVAIDVGMACNARM